MNPTDHTDDALPTLAEFLTAHGWQQTTGGKWEKGGRVMTGSAAPYSEWERRDEKQEGADVD